MSLTNARKVRLLFEYDRGVVSRQSCRLVLIVFGHEESRWSAPKMQLSVCDELISETRNDLNTPTTLFWDGRSESLAHRFTRIWPAVV